jgi:hypothetical protein
VINGAQTLVNLDARNYFNFPAAETNLQSVFDVSLTDARNRSEPICLRW